MNGHSAVSRFADVKKAFHNKVTRRTAVSEEKVSVLEPAASKPGSVVDPFIQPDDGRHVVLTEVVKIRLRGVLA